MVDLDNLECHKAAEIFHALQGKELSALIEDIKTNGQQEPIVLMDGKILDGRNRYRACLIANVKPTIVEREIDDPLKFVLSANLHRRHMNESQRAMVATRIAKLSKGRPDKSANLRNKTTQDEASDLLNVSRRSTQHARTVEDQGAPELIQAVDAGELKVSFAEQLARLPKDEQKEILDQKEADVKAQAKAIRAARRNVEPGVDTDERYTPDYIIAPARATMGGIDLDPCSCVQAQRTVQAKTSWTKKQNGLTKDWAKFGNTLWINWPYSGPLPWIGMLCEFMGNEVSVCGLGKFDTSTKWYSLLAPFIDAICFPFERIEHDTPKGRYGKDATNFGQFIFYHGDHPDVFAENFKTVGYVVRPFSAKVA